MFEVWEIYVFVCYFAYIKSTLNLTLILSCSLIFQDGINITKIFYQQTSSIAKEYRLQCIYIQDLCKSLSINKKLVKFIHNFKLEKTNKNPHPLKKKKKKFLLNSIYSTSIFCCSIATELLQQNSSSTSATATLQHRASLILIQLCSTEPL